MDTIASHVEEALHVKSQVGTNKFRLLNLIVCTRNTGSAVTWLYIRFAPRLLPPSPPCSTHRVLPSSVKILYVVNIIGQIFLLNSFLGSRQSFYGFHVMNDLMHGREWEESVSDTQL